MDFLFKVAYYAAAAISSLIVFLLFLSGMFTKSAGETWRNKVIVLVAAGAGAALLFMSYRLGHQQSQWAAGLGMAVLALAVFAIIMFGGLLMFTKIHWQ